MKSNCAGIGNAATNFGEVISMCVVSVRLRHCNSDKEVSTFALLDTCSQGTFVTDDLLKKLGLSGVRTSINIKTLNGDKKVKSSLIEGLMVSKQPLSKDKKIQWVKLPKLYSREHIPVDSAEIATPEKLKKWRYLDSIAKDIATDDFSRFANWSKLHSSLGANQCDFKPRWWSICPTDYFGLVHCRTN